jgi:hypothetical protein
MPGTVSTACQTFQATLRRVWASGSTYSEMTLFLGVTKDQLFRLRDKLALPLRLDRSQRRKGPRHRDPTPGEIAAACAELRAKHLEQRRSEPERCYRPGSRLMSFRVEEERGYKTTDPIEQLIDDMG